MNRLRYKFSGKTTTYYFDAEFAYLDKLVSREQAVILTDEHVFQGHQKKLKGWKTIVIPAGEAYKVQTTVDSVIGQLIGMGADRKTFLIGMGGGVVTDIAGYIAAIYMRGIPCGFLPTSILSMVDASIGGKNGIDVGLYKNLIGTIRQPEWLLYDYSLLKTLPDEEWINGFAEIIKHAAIRDAPLFRELEKNKLSIYRRNKAALAKLIRRNAMIKSSVVEKDEFEQGDRKLLNFGHTLGHAIENLHKLPHGHAISIGMVAASMISEEFTDFRDTDRIIETLKRYGLPTHMNYDGKEVMDVLKMDKKKVKDSMNYILLKKIGQATIKVIPIVQLEKLLQSIITAR